MGIITSGVNDIWNCCQNQHASITPVFYQKSLQASIQRLEDSK